MKKMLVAPYSFAGAQNGIALIVFGFTCCASSIALGLWLITRTNWGVIAAALAWAFSH